MDRARTPRDRAGRRLLGRPAGDDGGFLVEVIVCAVIVLVVGLGVLAMVDRTTELSGQQRTQAIAGNVAQTELDSVRGLPLSKQSNLRRTTPYPVDGVTYTATTRADWINDTSQTPNCTTPGATADYMKVTTTVTYPNMKLRKPAVLDTIITPPVRAFNPNQGSLAVLINDRSGAPVPNQTVNLTGPATLSDATNDNGCVLWGYLTAGTATVSFSKTGWVMPNGSAAGGGTVGVIGDATTNANYQFDRGGSFRTNFKVRTTSGALIDTTPRSVRVDNGTGAGFTKIYDIGANGTSLDTSAGGLLFPFLNPYAAYADVCVGAKPPSADLTAPTLAPGGSMQAADTVLPAMHITVTNNGTPVNDATVRVITPCSTAYVRQTKSDNTGQLADPGFPYGESSPTGFTICATNGTRKLVFTGHSNTNFAAAGTPVPMDIGTSNSSSTTTSPNSCP